MNDVGDAGGAQGCVGDVRVHDPGASACQVKGDQFVSCRDGVGKIVVSREPDHVGDGCRAGFEPPGDLIQTR